MPGQAMNNNVNTRNCHNMCFKFGRLRAVGLHRQTVELLRAEHPNPQMDERDVIVIKVIDRVLVNGGSFCIWDAESQTFTVVSEDNNDYMNVIKEAVWRLFQR